MCSLEHRTRFIQGEAISTIVRPVLDMLFRFNTLVTFSGFRWRLLSVSRYTSICLHYGVVDFLYENSIKFRISYLLESVQFLYESLEKELLNVNIGMCISVRFIIALEESASLWLEDEVRRVFCYSVCLDFIEKSPCTCIMRHLWDTLYYVGMSQALLFNTPWGLLTCRKRN